MQRENKPSTNRKIFVNALDKYNNICYYFDDGRKT